MKKRCRQLDSGEEKILQEIKALKEIPGRTHAGIGTIPKDPISLLNFSDLNAWITMVGDLCPFFVLGTRE